MAHLLLRGSPLCTPTGEPIAVEAVLFDKDGTLSHSEPLLLQLARARLDRCLTRVDHAPQLRNLLERAYGLDERGVHPGGITAVGARDHNLIATATALTQIGHSWPDALAIAEEAFLAADDLMAMHPPPETLPGLIPLLDRLAGAGVRSAVISNDHQQGIRNFLEHHRLSERFCGIWSAEHHPRKPSAGAVHGLCAALGIPARRCALIGDASSDLRMAAAAGIAVALGYRSGWRRPADLDPGTLCLEHWDDLDAVRG